MSDAETETVITINREDLKSGFFTVWTSDRLVFDRLVRRVGGREKIKFLRIGRANGRERSWDMEVPVEYLNQRTFAIGARKPKTLTEAQRQALAERGRRAFGHRRMQTVLMPASSDLKTDLGAVAAEATPELTVSVGGNVRSN